MRGCGKGKEEEELWKEFQLNRVLLLFPSSLCGMCSRDLASATVSRTLPPLFEERLVVVPSPAAVRDTKIPSPGKVEGKLLPPPSTQPQEEELSGESTL